MNSFSSGLCGNIASVIVGFSSDRLFQRKFKRSILWLLALLFLAVLWFTLSMPAFGSSGGLLPSSIASIGLAASLAGMALAAGAMALFFAAHLPPLVALAALVLYIAAFAVGLGPIPWLLMAEILPARARGVASSVATLTNWTCSFVVTECFSTVLAARSPQGTFLLFALVCVAGALYVAAKVPETKGVSLDQIEALFNNAHL